MIHKYLFIIFYKIIDKYIDISDCIIPREEGTLHNPSVSWAARADVAYRVNKLDILDVCLSTSVIILLSVQTTYVGTQ